MQDQRVQIRYVLAGIFIVLVYVITESVAGLLAEIILRLHRLNLDSIALLKDHILSGQYLLYIVTFFNKFSLIALFISIAFAAYEIQFCYRITHDSRRQYKHRSGYASHGTAHWQTDEEVFATYHQDNRGILLGEYVQETPTTPLAYHPLPEAAFDNAKIANYTVHPFNSRLNQQYLVIGPPGSNKTTGFVLPNIFHLAQQGKSMVVTDPKGELHKLTAKYCKERGYKVHVLDYLHFRYGHRQNLLNYIYDEAQYAEIASMYIGATRNEGDKRDFWEEQAEQLFSALIGFVHQVCGAAGTLTHVYELVPRMSNPQYALELFERHNIKGQPMKVLHSLVAASKSENTMASIITTLSGKLQLFALSNVQSQSSTTDFDLAKLADEKTITYVWMSDSQKTYAPIISAFWTVFFNSLYERARLSGDRLPNELVPLIDEMGNIGKISDWDVKLTTMRSRGIYPMMIWHSLPQLQDKYGEKLAKAILASCDTKILLACNELDTAEFFTKYLGKTTIETQSRRGSQSIAAEMNNATNQFTGRDLMQPAEILKLDRDLNIVVQSGRSPVMLNKLPYRHWEYSICEKTSVAELPTYELEKELSIDDVLSPPVLNTKSQTPPTEENDITPEDEQTQASRTAAASIVQDIFGGEE